MLKVSEQKKENMKKIKDAYMKAKDEGLIKVKKINVQ